MGIVEKVYCKICKEEMKMFGVSEDGLFKYCCRNCNNKEYIEQKINYKEMGIPIIGKYWDF